MIIVKITIFLIFLFEIYVFWVRSFLKSRPADYELGYLKPWYLYLIGILYILAIIGTIASVVYLLFFR